MTEHPAWIAQGSYVGKTCPYEGCPSPIKYLLVVGNSIPDVATCARHLAPNIHALLTTHHLPPSVLLVPQLSNTHLRQTRERFQRAAREAGEG